MVIFISRKKLKFGLPKGSLNDPNRWSTEYFLKQAGFDIRGYSPGSRAYSAEIVNDKELEVMVDRPQNMPRKLQEGILDIAILGLDVREEWRLAGIDLIELYDLDYGFANLVVAVKNSLDVENLSSFLRRQNENSLVSICSTEYPLITQQKVYENKIYRELYGTKKPMIITKYGSFGNNPEFKIIESEGATEADIKDGLADIIVESSSSGKSLIANNLKSIETFIKSSARLYTTKNVLKDRWKAEKIDLVKILLNGVVRARQNDYIIFNVPRKKEKQMLGYLKKEKLYTKEPTIIRGGKYLEMAIETPKSKWLEIVYGLKNNGGEDIIKLNPNQIID